MRKKDENFSLPTRLKSKKESKSVPVHPNYSAGEDFYSIDEDKSLQQQTLKTKI